MIRRAIAYVVRPIWEAVVLRLPVDDPWVRIERQPRLYQFGRGARLDFAEYLKGESLVTVTSIEQIQEWLSGCKYEHDDVLFGESDFWQHPLTFEHLRTGDCEDHALWAWRKLIELGCDVDFVAGWCVRGGELDGRHAWLLLRNESAEYLVETVAHDKAAMMRPLAEAKDAYVPQFGVDRNAKRFLFAGYLLGEKMRLMKERSGKRIA